MPEKGKNRRFQRVLPSVDRYIEDLEKPSVMDDLHFNTQVCKSQNYYGSIKEIPYKLRV